MSKVQKVHKANGENKRRYHPLLKEFGKTATSYRLRAKNASRGRKSGYSKR